jgi:hypothetical protein
MLCLHLLQICLVYVNTLLVQQVLAEPQWANRLTVGSGDGLQSVYYPVINKRWGCGKVGDMARSLPPNLQTRNFLHQRCLAGDLWCYGYTSGSRPTKNRSIPRVNASLQNPPILEQTQPVSSCDDGTCQQNRSNQNDEAAAKAEPPLEPIE